MIVMESLKSLILIVIVSVLADFCEGQGNGRVFIGALGDSTGFTNVTSYSFNVNTPAPHQLPISIRVIDPTNPSQDVALQGTVDISCETSVTGLGYTAVDFQNLAFTGATRFSPITLNLMSPGRAVEVRCFGVSQGLTCPANTSADATPPQPQFCRSTSISDPITLSVRPSPIVSFCSPVITVPNDGQSPYQFKLSLSEPVEDNIVDVYCSVVPGGSLILSIQVTPVQIGQTDVQVSYTVTSRGTPVTVQCVAQSRGGGTQYQNTTSSVDSSRALFQSTTGRIQLIPATTESHINSFRGVLTLDDKADGDISFKCQAVVADNVGHALDMIQYPVCDFTTNVTTTNPSPTTTPASTAASTAAPVVTTDSTATIDPNITTETTTLPTTTSAPIDLSSPWILDDNSFVLPRDARSKTLVASRQRVVLAPATELVVLTCCVESSTPKYFNMSTTMLAANHLRPYFCTNCTGGPTAGTESSERVIQNPAFREVAPCPCDLTYAVCDMNCCCDQECSSNQRQTFSYCIPGPFGGQDHITPDRKCSSNHTFKDDWFPLMCVEFESNAFLGLFYGNTPSLTTESDFNIRLSQQPPFFSYREHETRYEDPNTGELKYKDGLNIKTRIETESTVYPAYGVLSLPERSVGGACLNTAPVRFLRDGSSQCVHRNVQEMCRADSIFSATTYLEPSSVTHPPCPNVYQILKEYGGENVTTTYVNYHCAVDDTGYVKSTLSYANSVLPTVSHTFSQELYNENCTEPCNDPACLQYNVDQERVTSLPPRCSWDNGYTRPPTPINGGLYCNNTVVDVRYLFTWTGQSIVSLHATIVLAPVRISATNPRDLTQSFDVKFQHEMSVNNNATDNYDNAQGPFQRSGNPGYDYGKPLVSGCSAGQDYVDRNTSRQMAVFKPGMNGLCDSASRQTLTFGDDVSSSCKLRLNIDAINNCTGLRQLLLNHLSVLFPSDVIGRQGSNDPFNPAMWVPVLREIPSLNDGDADVVSDNSTDEVYIPIDNLRGICHNVTSGVNLVILYGETGKVNNYTINEVVGARVSYTVTDWQMSCSGGNAVRCQNSSQFVETFMLSSSVTFIKIPASTPTPPIKFYTSKDPSCTTDTCARFYEDFDQTVCHYDTCMSQILYPLTKSYGADPPMYTLAVSLVAVLFIVGYFMITRPWF